ncbi:L domain-like protein [Anaeromyces robustus]|uniref:L domain-like protein n=1 Tax=Anaeromyces robustus TaxID=1754192 RepID=A0A1Y1XDC1_9FUNG|nr:L domain-like protein [Anaeromyces robustus]|eukprot:ORX83717.1 L domain-like protein [Anaeromyces robustus]
MDLKILLVILSYISITFAETYTCDEVRKNICSSCSDDDYQCKTDSKGNIYSLLINNQDFSDGIPDSIFNITSLTDLYLVNDKITTISKKIHFLKNLKRFDIRTNELTTLPHEIRKLKNLKYLKLSHNNITSVPTSIKYLKSLTTLYLNSCKLTSFPNEILHLTKLQTLLLGSNKLRSIPSDIENLKDLSELKLNNNLLKSLPYEIANLKNLKKLNLRSNCLVSIPVTIDQDKVTVILENNDFNRCSSMPIVRIDTPDKQDITSREEWTKDAIISITNAKNEKWNFEEKTTSIRGRGNSSWDCPKKPYALKLNKKQSILGMPEHKRWVLISNYYDNSLMRNEIAFYLSKTFKMDYTVQGQYVDLILNDEYLGLYWLGEAIKVDENRVNIDDGNKDITDDEDKDYLIEIDNNYDEIIRFYSPIREIPYMIKNEDYMVDDETKEITSGGEARIERFKKMVDKLEKLLYPDCHRGMDTNECSAPNESYSDIIDIDSWIKAWLVNEIMTNEEIIDPRSFYCTYDHSTNTLKAGPVWDFDWAALYENEDGEVSVSKAIYYNALFKSPSFIKRTKKLWEKYYKRINIETKIESLRKKLSTSSEYDISVWGRHDDPYDHQREDFDGEVDFLKSVILIKLSVVNDFIENL